uniref:Sterile alpha motif domain containing 9 like n=1 Tax=Acanthochromis polyacanthus TaxID=80966 RepID=A0A3Q1GXC2_9TELE
MHFLQNLRCAVVKPLHSATVVAQHAVELRQYEETDPQRCLPVLLLIENSDKEYLDDLRNELEVAINSKQIQYGTLCFILLSCRRSHDPEARCRDSPLKNVAELEELGYEPDFILTFVLMSQEFSGDYVRGFVEHLLQDIDHRSVVTRFIHYVALLNTYVQNSFISQSHCEALLDLTIRLEKFRQHTFEKSLSDQAKLVFLHLRDEKTHIKSIRIIHPLVAKEILQQLCGTQQTQSTLAMNLLFENVLFEHRFGREEYLTFLRQLFLRQARISKGDEYDSLFSPLIDHVRENEKSPDTAIEVLKEAFECFHKDPFFAQQLARLLYTHEKFKEAKHWLETAAKQLPNNSYILNTKGQVYRKWFQAKCKAIDNILKTPQNTADAVETALKSLECFRESHRVMTSCGSFKFEYSINIWFHHINMTLCCFWGVPRRSPYRHFFKPSCLKNSRCQSSPECIISAFKFQKFLPKPSPRLGRSAPSLPRIHLFGDFPMTCLKQKRVHHPLTWLAKKFSVYGKYFSEACSTALLQQGKSIPAKLTPFQKRMIIYQLGGGNFISILSKLTDQSNGVRHLEDILSLYPSNPIQAKFGQRDIINYIVSHISLYCLSSQNAKVAPLKDLQALCRQFPSDKKRCLPSALFLLTLLHWPEDHDSACEKESKYETVQSAVEHLEKGYWTKMKDIPQRKRRIYTHFFLGNGTGLDKFVHKTKFQRITNRFSVSEKRMKWLRGEALKMPEITEMLKRVSGWTEDGVVYLEGPQKKKFSILPIYVPSVPHSNENITFNVGFTFRGPVAYNIIVNE